MGPRFAGTKIGKNFPNSNATAAKSCPGGAVCRLRGVHAPVPRGAAPGFRAAPFPGEGAPGGGAFVVGRGCGGGKIVEFFGPGVGCCELICTFVALKLIV